MSAECPYGHGRQNVIQNITADLGIPKRSSDVIAVKLACGCMVGGEEYKAFAEEVQKLQRRETEDIVAVRKKSADRKAAAFRTFLGKGGEKNVAE